MSMDQEKFASLNQPSNANMPRATVETLKQIQKQGLSISIVKSNAASFPSTTSADSRPKQSVMTVDKAKVVVRPQTTPENKTLQTRLSSADARVSAVRVTTQSPFHENKTSTTQARPSQPASSESKGLAQNWSSQSVTTDSKSQVSIPSTLASKVQTGTPRINQIHVSEIKTPVPRSNQTILNENKSQLRVTPGQRGQTQQVIDGKMLNTDRINPTPPPDAKIFSNQVRTGQQITVSQDNKSNVRVVTQKTADVKIPNQVNSNKQLDGKTPQINRTVPNVKVLPAEAIQGKVRLMKPEGKSSIGVNTPIIENKTVRMVSTNVIESGGTRSTQCKSSQMRVHQGSSATETGGVVQTKMICTTAVTTKMICYQSVPGQPDKNMILQGTKVTASSSDMIQKATSAFDVSSESPHGNPLLSRNNPSKRPAIFGSPAKKRCYKRIVPKPPEMCSKSQDASTAMTSPEDGNENQQQFFNNLKTSRTGLTITPVRSSTPVAPSSAPNAVGVVRMPGELIDKDMYRLAWENNATLTSPRPRGKPRARGKRKYVEPVCLTLSSDDEEEHMQAPFNSFEEAFNQAHMFPQESEGSKSGQSSPVYQEEESAELQEDDPQFPGVTDIHPKSSEALVQYEEEEDEEDEEKEMDEMGEEESMGEEEEEELEESDMEDEEEEEVPPEEDEEEQIIPKTTVENVTGLKQPLQCRSIRIGSYKIHPKAINSVLKVYLAPDGISFSAPVVTDSNKIVKVILKPSDITQMYIHFGKCLPILFVFTTTNFAESLRKALNTSLTEMCTFDPNSDDERVKKITFLIDTINEEQRQFLRYSFLNERKVRELDQKTANEILVKSTPSHNQAANVVRCEAAQPFPIHHENVSPSVSAAQAPQPSQPTLQMLKIAPSQPAIKLLTYPPPPQTGGICITNEDLACLNEGEFLNDAIIDFYLKYVFYEKLSDYHREKTHIFSSYFYPRLTFKQERPRAGDDVQKNIQMRRHSQVKTWTRHVDIFSKDFIIIPVNQNVHWFLAIICYPGLVPEAPELPPKPEVKTNNKSSDNVTSTDDQEENKIAKEPNSTVDGNNQNSDENSTASSSSMFEQEEPDSEEPSPEAPDSSTHPDKNRRRKEAPCICIFDSLNGPNRSRIATLLREYLEVEWKMKKGTRKVFDKNTMQGFIMQCPQQTNYSDCGIYLLQYVESFFENPIPYFDSPIPNLSNWFPKEKVTKKRQELKELILKLKNKYSAIPSPASRKTNASDSVPSSPAQTLQTDNR